MSASRTLKEILQDKIQQYLNDDNAVPKTGLQKITAVFSPQGKAGRDRAVAYSNKIATMDENTLIVMVYEDCFKNFNQGSLGTSTKLRERLMEGMCEHYGIDVQAIQNEAQAQSDQFKSFAGPHGGVPLPPEAFKTKLFKKQIEEKVSIEQIKRSLRENPVVSHIDNFHNKL